MDPARRVALIARAKSVAIPVHSCVAASLRPDHLLLPLSRTELLALVIVLAEAADPAILRALTETRDDDGRPDLSRHDVMLREAHRQARALRAAGREVPLGIARLERDYYRAWRRQHPGPAYQRPTGSPVVAGAIRQARRQAGMSQRALAEAVGVGERMVRRWELAERTPGAESWTQLEFTLGPLGVVRDAGPEPEAATEESDAA